jgi:hypothetical protein
MTFDEAVEYLVTKGMKPVSDQIFSDQHRIYFSRVLGEDVFLDHSATITIVPEFDLVYVSDFT